MRKEYIKSVLAIALVWGLTACGGGSGSPAQTHATPINDEEHNETTITEEPIVTGGDTVPSVKSLKLVVAQTALEKTQSTEVKVIATLSDGSTKDVTDEVAWVSEPNATVAIDKNSLKAMKNTPTTLKAKLNENLSNEVEIDITLQINGVTLPYEPIPQKNNATLRGIDSNVNGIRDDVEIKIYEAYAEKHTIYMEIAKQTIAAYTQILEHPENAKALRAKVNASYLCASYYKNYAKYYNEAILVNDRIDLDIKGWFFNTEERKNAYKVYDTLLSGEVYTLPSIKEMKSYCDFNTSQYGGE